jgi:endonuclease YncB( thermonuclease family)
VILCVLLAAALALTVPAAEARDARPEATARPAAQAREHGRRVPVPMDRVAVEDGDTLVIRWPAGDPEVVRILGVDAPETRHPEHDIPHAQPFGAEARAFAEGAVAAAPRLTLLRARTLDPYGRTLGYVFLGDKNYSVLVVAAGLAVENVGHFGDNGLPDEAAAVLAAARAAGPPPFEPPYVYRARMRELSRSLRRDGKYPPR